MTISELVAELESWKKNWGDLEVIVDDGHDFMDDVTLRASCDGTDPNCPPTLRIFSPKSLERK